MHIPDGFLDGPVIAGTAAVAAGGVGYARWRARAVLDDRQAPLLGVTAAFVFAAQTINFPVGAGTSGHLLGAALATVLLGPWLACLLFTVVLTTQSLLFADGGIPHWGQRAERRGARSGRKRGDDSWRAAAARRPPEGPAGGGGRCGLAFRRGIEERYRDREDYVGQVTIAAGRLVRQRLLLTRDIKHYVETADRLPDWRRR